MQTEPHSQRLLIVGQGLAGTTLAHLAEQNGISFRIVDSGQNHCSHVAAGIMHPMVFRKLTNTWGVPARYSFARDFYQGINLMLGKDVFTPIRFIRLHGSEHESMEWRRIIEDKHMLGPGRILENNEFPPGFNTAHGASMVEQAFRLRVKEYCELSASRWKDLGRLTTHKVTAKDLSVNSATSRIRYDVEEYDAVVLAMGHAASEFRPTDSIPVGCTKGEVLAIMPSPTIPHNTLVNGRVFCLGEEDGSAIVGSNFKWNDTSLSPSREGREEVLDKFEYRFQGGYRVLNHWSGIRPTSPDRRPMIGKVPNHHGFYILNGLGAKGVSTCPSVASNLLRHILHQQKLDPEIDLYRFRKIQRLADSAK